MTSKQRAFLKSRASTLDTILIIGKDGITDNVIKQADDALEARELIKIKCLENAMLTIKEAAEDLSEKTNSQVVYTIGSKAVLYRVSGKNPRIVLPE